MYLSTTDRCTLAKNMFRKYTCQTSILWPQFKSCKIDSAFF